MKVEVVIDDEQILNSEENNRYFQIFYEGKELYIMRSTRDVIAISIRSVSRDRWIGACKISHKQGRLLFSNVEVVNES